MYGPPNILLINVKTRRNSHTLFSKSVETTHLSHSIIDSKSVETTHLSHSIIDHVIINHKHVMCSAKGIHLPVMAIYFYT